MEKRKAFTLPTVSGEDENESLLSVFAMVTISAQLLIATVGYLPKIIEITKH